MQVNNLLNAGESADFLEIHKPDLYKDWLDTGKLRPVYQTGRIKLYALADLKRIKKLLQSAK